MSKESKRLFYGAIFKKIIAPIIAIPVAACAFLNLLPLNNVNTFLKIPLIEQYGIHTAVTIAIIGLIGWFNRKPHDGVPPVQKAPSKPDGLDTFHSEVLHSDDIGKF